MNRLQDEKKQETLKKEQFVKCRVYLKISMININCVKKLNEVLTRNVFVRHGSLAEWNSLVRGLPILGSGYRIRIHPCFRASEVLHSIQFIKIYLNNVKKPVYTLIKQCLCHVLILNILKHPINCAMSLCILVL